MEGFSDVAFELRGGMKSEPPEEEQGWLVPPSLPWALHLSATEKAQKPDWVWTQPRPALRSISTLRPELASLTPSLADLVSEILRFN